MLSPVAWGSESCAGRSEEETDMRCDASSESHRFFFVRSFCTFLFLGRMRKRMRLKRNIFAAMRRLRATGSLSVGIFFFNSRTYEHTLKEARVYRTP